MRPYIALVASIVVAMSLAACGSKSEGNKNKGRPTVPTVEKSETGNAPTYEEANYQADIANLEATEKALAATGLQFAKIEVSDAGEKEGEGRTETQAEDQTEDQTDDQDLSWQWDERALGEFSAKNPTANPKDAIPALKNYVTVAKGFVTKYSRVFNLKKANGSIESNQQLGEERIVEINEKVGLSQRKIESLEKAESTQPTQPSQVTPPANKPATPAASQPAQPVVPPAATKPPVQPAPSATTKSVQPAPQPPPATKPVEPAPQVPPASKPAPSATTKPAQPAQPARVTCEQFLAPLVKRNGLTCRVVGKYDTFDINNVTTQAKISSTRGMAWKLRAQRGVETKYTARIGDYQVPLLTLGVAPLALQATRDAKTKSTESCAAGSLKVTMQVKPDGQDWQAPEVTEITKNGNELVVKIVKAKMNLKLNCR